MSAWLRQVDAAEARILELHKDAKRKLQDQSDAHLQWLQESTQSIIESLQQSSAARKKRRLDPAPQEQGTEAGPTLSRSDVKDLRVKDLRVELKARGLSTAGRKADLAARLLEALDEEAEAAAASPDAVSERASTSPAASEKDVGAKAAADADAASPVLPVSPQPASSVVEDSDMLVVEEGPEEDLSRPSTSAEVRDSDGGAGETAKGAEATKGPEQTGTKASSPVLVESYPKPFAKVLTKSTEREPGEAHQEHRGPHQTFPKPFAKVLTSKELPAEKDEKAVVVVGDDVRSTGIGRMRPAAAANASTSHPEKARPVVEKAKRTVPFPKTFSSSHEALVKNSGTAKATASAGASATSNVKPKAPFTGNGRGMAGAAATEAPSKLKKIRVALDKHPKPFAKVRRPGGAVQEAGNPSGAPSGSRVQRPEGVVKKTERPGEASSSSRVRQAGNSHVVAASKAVPPPLHQEKKASASERYPKPFARLLTGERSGQDVGKSGAASGTTSQHGGAGSVSQAQKSVKPASPQKKPLVALENYPKPFAKVLKSSQGPTSEASRPNDLPNSKARPGGENRANAIPRPAKAGTSKPSAHGQQPVKVVPSAAAEDSYAISDREGSSDEDTDEEEERRRDKSVPSWARGTNLRQHLARQFSRDSPLNPDTIFPPAETCNLERIFKLKKARYAKRTSSAMWASEDFA